ncbi:Apocarotenoid-15,15'-oxygenase [Euhalothece natronophila Z-M001]|uniref:Apocarotenoid-15,15'-oxygenase n=1 Tax=Euhalothece natronophila Z-M001 TaxID=522448 RepID=A0A5B8NM72_9CHRO|nr:carotenoid oxygenase family protein [Euhalothece natronophila]QDZ40047.1 Apocarotenoid-15,15'-oxygenase [Euhalothece natronophila Z-M001]
MTSLASNATPEQEKPYSKKQWQRGYDSQRREESYELELISGAVPKALQGTLFRNGPGLLDINGIPVQHPFDGDGMICKFSFQEGKVHFQNRFVRTQGFIEEQEAGTILYRNVFGTQKPGGWLQNAFDFKQKNIANTNVIYWGNKLLALWEGGLPHRLDPKTLETLGIDKLHGILGEKDAFAAHPWIEPQSALNNNQPCLINFYIEPGLSTTIHTYDFDANFNLLRKQSHNVPGFAFIHDFAITPNYYIFFQNPVKFNPIPFALGLRGAGECIKFHPEENSQVWVIPRNTNSGESVKKLEVNAGFIFHHGNAFEINNQQLCVDSICYADFPEVDPDSDFRDVDFEALHPGQLWRFTLNLETQVVDKELVEPRCCEFPAVHPNKVGQPYRYLFMATAHQSIGNAPLQGILKYDWQTQEHLVWSNAPHGFVSEPTFVPKPDSQTEDEGWVLTLVYNGKKHCSEFVILEGKTLEEIARLGLKYHIPYGLHGSWISQVIS